MELGILFIQSISDDFERLRKLAVNSTISDEELISIFSVKCRLLAQVSRMLNEVGLAVVLEEMNLEDINSYESVMKVSIAACNHLIGYFEEK